MSRFSTETYVVVPLLPNERGWLLQETGQDLEALECDPEWVRRVRGGILHAVLGLERADAALLVRLGDPEVCRYPLLIRLALRVQDELERLSVGGREPARRKEAPRCDISC